jgi:hypothetical protein
MMFVGVKQWVAACQFAMQAVVVVVAEAGERLQQHAYSQLSLLRPASLRKGLDVQVLWNLLSVRCYWVLCKPRVVSMTLLCPGDAACGLLLLMLMICKPMLCC